MGIWNLLSKCVSERGEMRDRAGEIAALVRTIATLTKENESLKETRDRYWKLYSDLKENIDKGSFPFDDLPPYIIQGYIKRHSVQFAIEEDEEYVRLINKEDRASVSFRREFDKQKDNHNWVDEGRALITLTLDGFNYKFLNPTLVSSPASGIFETDKSKLIQFDEEICRIRKYNQLQKAEVLEGLERRTIKEAVLKKEFKKRVERETLDELIAEGKIFNAYTDKDGRRSTIPMDVASAVWNRDGGKCCFCGSNKELEFDHIIPISKGGASTFRNLQLLCKKCNLIKSDNI